MLTSLLSSHALQNTLKTFIFPSCFQIWPRPIRILTSSTRGSHPELTTQMCWSTKISIKNGLEKKNPQTLPEDMVKRVL